MRVAVIPARGGSKRIPRKNIRNLCGKPMIGYSIDCALRSGLFDRVMVSTDDEEIARTARDFGAEVPFLRPAELADDHAGTIPVIAHAVGWLMDRGVDLSAVCCIYPTAPFILPPDLRRALTLLETGGWQYVFPATTFAAPIFRSFRKNPRADWQCFFRRIRHAFAGFAAGVTRRGTVLLGATASVAERHADLRSAFDRHRDSALARAGHRHRGGLGTRRESGATADGWPPAGRRIRSPSGGQP